MLKFALVLAVIAIGVYLLVRALEKRRPGGGGSPARPGPARPMGPDDDPDFLWDLNKKVRRPRGPAAPEPAPDPSDPAEQAPDDLSGLDPDSAEPRPDRGDEPPEPIR
ncbi:hypothetical protein [Nocardioides zeae]|uniref:hypothetical protein n=1 Tax=Nocardioides zeae TaxID=1457234 RepID=UPI00188594B9|nr:hypothetical protein [Nocardioides zeae]